MGITKSHRRLLIAFIVILFTATACFQGSVDEPGSQQSSLIATTVPPSNTPIPSETPEPSDTPVQAEAADAEDVPISSNPTATEEPLEVAQIDDEEPVQTDSPFELTATRLIELATLEIVVPLTQTAAANQNLITESPTATDALQIGQTPGTSINTGADCVHEVSAGENLFRLSLYYGVPVVDIANRSGVVNPNVIVVGQRLIIPGCGTTGALPPPTSIPTSTLASTGAIGGPGTTNTTGTVTTVGCATQYTVQQYDTLFQLSLTYGVPVQSIANANGIANISRIDMGDVLCIPAQ